MADTANKERVVSNLVNYSSSENSQEEEGVDYSSEEGNQENSSQSSQTKTSQEYAETVESFEIEEPVAGPSTTDAESLNGDTNGGVSSGTADSSFTDEISDDESICRSPAKSPVKKVAKLSEVLKRKRQLDLEANSEAAEANLPTDQDFKFKEPKFRKKKFIFHPFIRNQENICVPDQTKDPVEVIIPEQLAASYGLYIWPSAPVLAWYIWLNQDRLAGKRVLELGAGTALPGLLAAKLGSQVILTDSLQLPHCLENCREGIQLNNLKETVSVVPLTWGSFTSSTLKLRGAVDLILGSDLFFDPEVFEPLLVTVSWLLRSNPAAEFICSVQERAADWSIEPLLLKWKLSCAYIRPAEFLKGSGINERDLTGNHTIFLLKIFNNEDQ